jgi:hypothetical protein
MSFPFVPSLKHAALLAATLFPMSATAATYTAPQADGYRGVWYEITNGSGGGSQDYRQNKYGGAMATYPQQHAPIAIRKQNAAGGIDRTYFVFGGDGGGSTTPNMVGYYDHTTGLMARPRTILTRGQLDAHENPTLAIDDEGHLFVFSSGHGSSRKAIITKSASPWEIDRWDRVLELDGGSSKRETFSYGQPHYVSGQGFLLLNTYYEGGGNRTLYTNSSQDGVTWKYDWSLNNGSNPRPALAAIEEGQYQTSWAFGDMVATIFNMHPTGAPGTPLDYRTNLYYAETSDLGESWQTADGTTLSGTLTNAQNPALVFDYEAQGLNVYLKDVQQDADGNPVLLYLTSGGPQTGPQNGPRTLRTARFDATLSEWIIRDVLQTDHNYDHGSLYVEGDTWRLIGPWIDGPQHYGTGGEIGVWTSDDMGETWSFDVNLTPDVDVNHSYVRRPVNAADDFYGLWASGHAWNPGDVDLYFTTKDGAVYQMPTQFADGQEFAAPILIRAIPEPSSALAATIGVAAVGLRRTRRD